MKPFAGNPLKGRIVGGHETLIQVLPYQVSLQRFGHHSCGASIISPKFVVTAAHCISGYPEWYSIRSGSTNHSEGGTLHRVKRVIVHEKNRFNDFGMILNDIALVEVCEPFDFDNTRRAIELFNQDEKSSSGSMAVVSGWGATEDLMKLKSDNLRSVAVPIVEQDICVKAYEDLGGVPEGQICAALFGIGGKDACQNDSGGPLTIDGRLAGVASWGYGCGRPEFPGVYTEIAHYRTWIDKKIQAKVGNSKKYQKICQRSMDFN